jgi:hypothetical protein
MAQRHPVANAADIVLSFLAETSSSAASVPEAIELVRWFANIQFEVPQDSDSDGYLFQFGSVNWLPEPTFVLSVVRQLEVVDQHGEHEHYEQVLFEFRYPLDAELEAARSHSEWWFPHSDTTFHSWMDSVERAPILEILARKHPQVFEIRQDRV